MIWRKKRPKLNTVQEVIEANTNIPIQEFLHPKENPYLQNLTEAVAFVKEEIQKGTPISIVGDYDVDGVCASTILFMGINEATGKEPHVRIPRRFTEGYGLSMKIIDEINEGLIITVDNGIAALEQIKAAKEKGLKVVIIDHHLPVMDEETGEFFLPDADVILDPHAIPGSDFIDYCGAGLAYHFVKELVPDYEMMTALLVFASIATVADVMPLIGDNRNIVIKGLEAIRERKVTLGLNTLLNELKLEYVTEGDYGFKLGPVINAAGRLYDDGPEKVFHLLKTHVEATAANYTQALLWCQERAELLKSWNTKRQELVHASMQVAHAKLKEMGLEKSVPIVLYDPSFSEGIIGIIAGQLAEEYRTPALVFTDSHTPGVLKGSGRTYGTVHLKHLLDKAKDILLGYGGHAGAAGMSLKFTDIGCFRSRLSKELDGVDFGVDPNVYLYDLEITTKEAKQMIQELNQYAPYGEGNPPISFFIKDFELSPAQGKFTKTMGNRNQHVKFLGKEISAVGFDMRDRYLEMGEPKVMDFVGSLNQNYFNGYFYDQIEVFDFHKKKKETTDVFQSLEELLIFS